MRLQDVWFRYARGAAWTLRGVNLTLPPGAVAVVEGPNGAGKSTLLQLAAGVLRPGRGTVEGRPPVVGWVPERFPADQPFTARALLRHMARIRGGDEAQIERWAERLGFTGFLDVRLSRLSKGSAQKIGLVQALLVPPDLLVLDEPWEGLDAQTREHVPQIVGEVVARGGAVLISDHLGEVGRLPGARRWHVRDGEVREDARLEARRVIEVAVAAADTPEALERLRAGGFEILAVREEVVPR
ncbi:ATP-binding cassette domain-containing protein [Dactylosporangium sp. AC04546]|uniref:ATP-binding cassette domain-containing protein n=1 Tax=Dactylosporangium sp. AC04546 TaxID=2862460 RepID=UPI001EE0C68E|nr:ATP-binding cassette domain-containing protein [Dactylosporangium sp. AC04546]WVK83219.1 ATP-binding cassette domain-containing protein [Dactylosporangium sp. AC04546]